MKKNKEVFLERSTMKNQSGDDGRFPFGQTQFRREEKRLEPRSVGGRWGPVCEAHVVQGFQGFQMFFLLPADFNSPLISGG